MAWVYLIIAGIFEWGWPVGLKLGLVDSGLGKKGTFYFFNIVPF